MRSGVTRDVGDYVDSLEEKLDSVLSDFGGGRVDFNTTYIRFAGGHY